MMKSRKKRTTRDCVKKEPTEAAAPGPGRWTRVRHGIVAVALVAYASCFIPLSIIQHRNFRTQMNDLGNADQAIWFASKRVLSMPQSNTDHPGIVSRFDIHANLIFWLLGILYAVRPDPEWLLAIASLSCAAAGAALYAFARRRLGESWWTICPPLVFLISPIVHDANMYDFHTVTLGTAFLVWSVWALDARHSRFGLVLLLLAMMCKETIAVTGAMLGIWLMLSGRRRLGGWICVASCAYLVVILKILTPIFNSQYGYLELRGPDNRYAWLGDGPGGFIKTVLQDPEKILNHLLKPSVIRVPLYLLLAGAGASVSAWPVLLMMMPDVVGGIFSSHAWTTRITGTYYWMISFAVIVLGGVVAAQRAREKKARFFYLPLLYLSLVTAVLSLFFSPLPYGRWSWWENYASNPDRAAFDSLRKLIPADASLCVQNNLGPHFSQRKNIVSYPKPRCRQADYAFFYLRYVGGPDAGLFPRTLETMLTSVPPWKIVSEVQELSESPDWGIVSQRDGFYLFARGRPRALDREKMRAQITEDSFLFQSAYYKASEGRPWWAGYLTGSLTWEYLAKMISGSNRRG